MDDRRWTMDDSLRSIVHDLSSYGLWSMMSDL